MRIASFLVRRRDRIRALLQGFHSVDDAFRYDECPYFSPKEEHAGECCIDPAVGRRCIWSVQVSGFMSQTLGFPQLQCLCASVQFSPLPFSSLFFKFEHPGALTNAALLLTLFPEAAEEIEQIVLMGGAIGPGNTNPSAEFNMQVCHHICTPSQIAFGCWIHAMQKTGN